MVSLFAMMDILNRPERRESPLSIILQLRKCQRQKGQRELQASRKKTSGVNLRRRDDPYLP
jgi:hypothetical protein